MYISKMMATRTSSISRRNFLKLSAAGLASLILSPIADLASAAPETNGRVIDDGVELYDIPSLKGERLLTYWKDIVIPINEVTLGDEEPAHNRVWYHVHGKGYVHSGKIQPVTTNLNQPVAEIPFNGALAEVTVPFTDAHWRPDKKIPVAYRFYYETTHWVTKLVYSESGDPWYRLSDDKWDLTYYAPAEHLRVIPLEELAPLSPDVPAKAKRLEVLTEEQVVIAYEYDRPIFMTRTATGARFSNGDFRTPAGRHITAHKRPYRHMAAGNLAYNGYDLPGVPWVCYITESGISFHGTFWHNNFGRPRSHGCINLTPKAAKWIFRWTQPYLTPGNQYVYEEFGTAVDVI